MNTLNSNSLGKILSKTRKSLNLSKRDIANKLCLKLDIIKDIENDIITDNIYPVFFYGYINSYIRLLNLSDKYLFSLSKINELNDNKYINDEFNYKYIFYKIINFIYINISYFVKLLFLIFINIIYFYYLFF